MERLRYAIGGLTLLGILAVATTFRVPERHAAIVTRFGQPVRTVTEPGLHFKWPWPVDSAVTVDQRTRLLDTRHTEMLTRDKKNVILLSYATWRVEDPLAYHRAVGTLESGDQKVDGLVTNAQIGVLGRYDLTALVSTDEQARRVDDVERDILQAVQEVARRDYGIAVDEVGLRRVSFPQTNVAQVFEQMRTERKRFAAQYRAEGRREAARIRSEADLEKAEILADATEESARIRGEAEAEAARIYAEAHRSDPEFYRFLRQLEGLENSITTKTTLILRTDSEPFGLLEESR